MTNAIAFVKCFNNDANANAMSIYKVISENSYRGSTVALAINDKTTSGNDISNFKLDSKIVDNISKAPSKNRNSSTILGFYNEDLFTNKKTPNVAQLGNVYYLATEGTISNKYELSEMYSFDQKLTTTEFLINYFKMNFQLFNNPKDAIMETVKYLEGDYSFILYINPLNTVYWYTTTALFTRLDDDHFVISSEPIDPRVYVRSDNKVLYNNVLSASIISLFKKPHARDMIYICMFDHSIESVVLMYLIKELFNPKLINVITDVDSYLDVQYALQDDKVFNVVRDNNIEEDKFPEVFVDHINIDSSDRVISDIHDLCYRASVEEPYIKYYPIFQKLRITDIVKLGIYLNIPFNKFKLCTSPSTEYYKDRTLYNCGECQTCIRTKSVFDKIGFNVTDDFIPYKNHKIVDNLKVKNCEHFNKDDLDIAWFNKIVDTITEDAFKYVG